MISFPEILILNLSFPIFGIFLILILPVKEKRFIKLVAFNFNSFSFLGFILIWVLFDKSTVKFQFVNKLLLLSYSNVNLNLGVDGISLFFLLLSTFLIPVCLLSSWHSIQKYLKEFFILFSILNFFLINVFCCTDMLFFYIFFESVLIPMFLIIGIWGSRERKTLAAFYFFLYTLIGSIIMILSILYILNNTGTTDYEIILTFSFSLIEQKCIWVSMFLAFAGKIPMVPLHLWLPEAHVEAPTAGSVILAGILLKLGSYGFIRYLLPVCPAASMFFAPLIYSLVSIGVIFSSFTAIRQTDFKRVIAYTSIAHMNFVILGVFSFNTIGLEGAIFQSLSHGFIASGLFLIIGVIYERFRTRIVYYLGGLAITMPLFSSFFLFFSLANIGFPGTSSFVGELLLLTGSFKINCFITVINAFSMVVSAAYALFLFNRICYGNLKTQYINSFLDLNYREFLILTPLMVCSVVSGVYSNIFLNSIHVSVNYLIELFYI
uniref:NADH-ubiquinone oxidoreductase chain 4 n=1 Tax=Surirella sp. TaxID=1526603 RepID=A0A2R4A3K5_9STRA|nr:NADH dehydrogenase subunit 4 [Surirella sp.]